MLSSIAIQPTTTLLQAVWQTATMLRYPIAISRMPQTSCIEITISFSALLPITPTLNELPKGFLVSPFVNENKAYFIQADLYWNEKTGWQYDNSQEKAIDFLAQIENFDIKRHYTTNSEDIRYTQTTVDFEAFETTIQQAVAAMQRGDFQKVVLSRTKNIILPPEFDVIDTLLALCEKYPSAFISLIQSENFGTWIGATPEVLISQDEQGIFKTMALAGTQRYHENLPLQHVQWKQKEIEEQALVSRYIINCFKKIRLREFDEDGPRTVQAGNLLHLRTDFTVDTKAVRFPQLAEVMLELLHPTSAVCGLPKAPALDFILQHEPHQRELFSGWLGTVNGQFGTHIFVNLRCAKLYAKTATLFAGMGILKESDAWQEWQEAEAKFDTLLAVLANETK